jgi:hypothetical protein
MLLYIDNLGTPVYCCNRRFALQEARGAALRDVWRRVHDATRAYAKQAGVTVPTVTQSSGGELHVYRVFAGTMRVALEATGAGFIPSGMPSSAGSGVDVRVHHHGRRG